jgi:hypothetical protein
MKEKLLLLALLCCAMASAQQKITFNYDAAGNQSLRELCLSGCSSSGKPAKDEDVKEIAVLTDEGLKKFSPEDAISYYPNPVKEELYIKWELEGNNYVSSIQIFNMNGELLRSYQPASNNNNQNIPFQIYSEGVYLVVLEYSNGAQKTIKIIKK